MMYFSSGKERCVTLGTYLVENKATVRAVAAHFGISKSTIHKDLAYKLKYINPVLYSSVKEILDYNKAERHLRGGEATKRKYLKKKQGRVSSDKF